MEMMGMMTGLNRLGAKWTGAHGFCATVMRAELGMNGYIISDFYKNYMDPILGVLNGNDLIDGNCIDKSNGDGKKLNFNDYKEGYGELAWAMRESAHRILYTVVRSNAMNYMTSDMTVISVTPTWQKVLNGVTIATDVLFAACLGGYVITSFTKRRFW
jgi:beta-glucosidase